MWWVRLSAALGFHESALPSLVVGLCLRQRLPGGPEAQALEPFWIKLLAHQSHHLRPWRIHKPLDPQ